LKKRSLIVLVGAIALALAGGAGGLYAFDSAKSDRIAEGVTVAGIDLGGYSERTARARLQARLAPQLERPVTLEYADRRFVLSPQQAAVHADVDRMVREALGRSREGSFVGRAFRELSGGKVRARLPLRVAYSPQSVAALVARVRKSIDEPAQSASIDPTGTSLNVRDSRMGVRVLGGRLRRAIVAQLRRPDSIHVVLVPTTVVKPKLSSWQLALKYPAFITIARGEYRLRFWDHLKLKKTYMIAVGRAGLETPAGLYHIDDKQTNPSWHVPKSAWAGALAGRVIPPGPDDPIKARWMGFYAGAGIHGTEESSSLGSAASHGCIRMAIPDVIELYDMVPYHTPIFIQ
jgi:lipoprotein-anchoring transpeptidase ErfK/SrfK